MSKKEDTLYENIKLNKSFYNYKKIVNKKLPYKFSYLDEWMFKNSKLLLNETNKTPKTYRKFKRGTIVKVDFGVNLGSEMSQVHFAIVLSKNDNPKNNVITVLPLTSKKGKYNLNLGTLVIDKLVEKVSREEKRLKEDFGKINIKNLKAEVDYDELQYKSEKLKSDVDDISTVLDYYTKNLKSTYGCTNLITTISKSRLLNPINKFDIIGKSICSDEVLNIIDKDVIEKITNFTK